MHFSSIEAVLDDVKNGKPIIVIDDPGRENEGDLYVAAEKISGESVNFMATYGKGLICMPVEAERMAELDIRPMVEDNTDSHQTAFTVAIDHVSTTTGISAFERAITIQKVLEDSKPEDFKRPGHVFPLIAKQGGVLERNGHTEAAIDLAKLAGLKPAGVICEILKDDGTMARTDDLLLFAKEHALKVITIEDLVNYMQARKQPAVSCVVETQMPTKHGEFRMFGFIDEATGEHHVALVAGDLQEEVPLVRVHSECLTGDALGSKRCDCGEQYDEAMKRIAESGNGVLVYMRQEGRGIGLINKLKAYALQDKGQDTVEANLSLGFDADLRSYDVAAVILKKLGATKIRLMTNNPEKMNGLVDNGIEVVSREQIQMNHNEKNYFYLKTKKEKMSHHLEY